MSKPRSDLASSLRLKWLHAEARKTLESVAARLQLFKQGVSGEAVENPGTFAAVSRGPQNRGFGFGFLFKFTMSECQTLSKCYHQQPPPPRSSPGGIQRGAESKHRSRGLQLKDSRAEVELLQAEPCDRPEALRRNRHSHWKMAFGGFS